MEKTSMICGNQALPIVGKRSFRPSRWCLLITVFAEDGADFRGLDAVDDRSAAEVPLAFMAHPRGQMAGARAAVLHFSLGGQAETLLCPFMGLHLWHNGYQSAFLGGK